MERIKPEVELREILLNVRRPGRYVGGEYGIISEVEDGDFKTAVCFPDLYEIGMSNQAIKILYREFNAIDGIVCERVFAPDTDFEQQLIDNNLYLYTLESGIPLKELDLLAISIGYELAATNILTILERGGIAIFNDERDENSPIVIAGGPAITNPLPFAGFLDGVFIGEAEENFEKTLIKLRDAKKKGGNRRSYLKIIDEDENIWTYKKHREGRTAVRASWMGFGRRNLENLPVSSVSSVQDNGIIEIMRGCPNSCRFCHAGYFYRPYRQKRIDDILMEADFLINKCGYNEITLSSLSSGDYKNLTSLIKALNLEYGNRNISFSLPSLRINSFTLPLLEELSKGRKSGLTFAVETPEENWQRSINKEIDREKIIEILKEAKRLGWKVAKFYFMIGLPLSGNKNEEKSIAEYIDYIQKNSGLRINVNVGTFIPKPHTPFQWAYQLTSEESYRKLTWLKAYFKQNRNVKLSYHTPFVSFLEGVISRGDERVGELIISAHKKGARLDAWTEYFKREIWEEVFTEASWDIEDEICRERETSENLPWDTVDLGVNKKYLIFEYKKSKESRMTPSCEKICSHNCGICNEEIRPVENEIDSAAEIKGKVSCGRKGKYLFKYRKKGKAVFLSHINMMNIFQSAFQRALIALEYSKGFNPKPVIEFAHPLSLGIESDYEILSAEINTNYRYDEIIENLNTNLPTGIEVIDCKELEPYVTGTKKHSLMSLYGGSEYKLYSLSTELTPDIITRDIKKLFLVEKINIELTTEKEYVIIKLPDNGTKISNIMHVLKELYGTEKINRCIRICRLRVFKKNNGRLIDFYSSVK